jgi:hypothetical protein
VAPARRHPVKPHPRPRCRPAPRPEGFPPSNGQAVEVTVPPALWVAHRGRGSPLRIPSGQPSIRVGNPPTPWAPRCAPVSDGRGRGEPHLLRVAPRERGLPPQIPSGQPSIPVGNPQTPGHRCARWALGSAVVAVRGGACGRARGHWGPCGPARSAGCLRIASGQRGACGALGGQW